jgi:hypothetical protein
MLVHRRQKHGELVAAEPERLAPLPEPGGDLREDPVSGRVPELVVDALEVVDVEETERDHAPVLVRVAELALQPLVEMTVVAEAGERVREREAHRIEGAVRRALVERDRDKRPGQRCEQERRPLPEDDKHEGRGGHQREGHDRPADVRANQPEIAELGARGGDGRGDEQEVDGVDDRRGDRDLRQDLGRPGAREVRQGPARERAHEAEGAGVEGGSDRRVTPDERHERRRGHVDERGRRPAEEDERRDGEDEPQGDAVRVGALHGHREALRECGGDEERAHAQDDGRRAGVAGGDKACREVGANADERHRGYDRKQSRRW